MSPALLLAEVLEAAAARARELDAEQRTERRDWIDQATSALGRKRHCAAVRRRVAAGDTGAAIVGRRHVLSSEALAEELQRSSAKKPSKAKATSVADQLRAELRIVGGSR